MVSRRLEDKNESLVQLILRKIIIVATRCQILTLKCIKIDFGWGSAPDPAGGAYSVPPDSLAGFKGPTSKGRGGEWMERRAGKGKRGGKGRKGKGLKPPKSKFSGYVAACSFFYLLKPL